jgi:hypothetical protein
MGTKQEARAAQAERLGQESEDEVGKDDTAYAEVM